MNDQLLQYWNVARKYLSQIMIVLFLIMTSIVGLVFMSESNATADQLTFQPNAVQIWEPQKRIEEEPALRDFLTTFSSTAVPAIEAPEVVILVQNPWEIRTAKDQEKIEQEALRLHTEAKTAFERGNMERAETLANQARANKPDFKDNDELLEKIRAARAANEAKPQ